MQTGHSPAAGLAAAPADETHDHPILVVEDESIVAMELTARLEDLGFRVCGVADNGMDAIALAREHRPALALMDIVLRGEMDGIETSRHLAEGLGVPVIYLTAFNDRATVQRAVTTTPYGYLTKPFQEAELRAAVEVALHKSAADRRITRSERWHQAMLRSVADAVVATDREGRVTFMNPAAEDMTGWNVDDARGQPIREVMVLTDRHTQQPLELPLLRALRRQQTVGIEFGTWIVARDGKQTPIDDSAAPIHDDRFGDFGAIMAFRDVSARIRIEEALQDSEACFRSVFDHAPAGMVLASLDGTIQQANQAMGELLGRPAASLHQGNLADLTHPDDRAIDEEHLGRLHRSAVQGVEFEKRLVHAAGGEVPVQTGITLLRRGSEAPTLLFQYHDLSRRKAAEAQLAHLAHHDQLTGLANRVRLHDEMQHRIATAQRQGQRLAVMFMDLDLFKQVNDTLGHEAGDVLLREVADRLRACVRETDCVARLGGDEFVVVLSHIQTGERAGQVADKIRASIRAPVPIGGRDVAVGASLGIALYPDDGTDVATLLRCADSALYHAKETGRGQYQFYRPELTEQVARRLDPELGLRLALENGEFELEFQPVISVADARPVAAEALLRWRHPTRGLVMPDTFIPVAEESGMIDAIGTWVLDAACAAATLWRSRSGGTIDVCVNVSPRQFRSPGLVDAIRAALARTGLPAGRLVLEITEQALLEATDRTQNMLSDLQTMGVRVMIDDFGIGYSALGYLQRFAPDGLKIDRSFIRDVTVDDGDAAIVSAVLAMARRLGLETVAEGVETSAQLEFLRSEGCETCQGYLFAPAMTAVAFQAWLDERGEP